MLEKYFYFKKTFNSDRKLTLTHEPSTLAACCKPSSGDPLKVILPKSHYARALRPESQKNASLRSQSASATTNHCGLQLGAQGRGFDPHGRRSFSVILFFEFSR